VGWCRLTVPKPVLKLLEIKMRTASNVAFNFKLRHNTSAPAAVPLRLRPALFGRAVQVDSIKTQVESGPGFST